MNDLKLKKATGNLEKAPGNTYCEKAVNNIIQMIPIFHESFIRSYERNASMFTQLQLAAMRLIIAKGPMPMNKIASQLSMSKQQLTRFIDTLVQKGMLRRFNKDNDRRTIYIEATEEGKEKVVSHSEIMRLKHVSKIENIPEEEQKELYECAHTFLAYLEKYWGTDDVG